MSVTNPCIKNNPLASAEISAAAIATHLDVASAEATAFHILESACLKYTTSPLTKASPAVKDAVIPDTASSEGVVVAAKVSPPPASSHATALPVEVKTCPSEPCAPPIVILSNSAVPSTSRSVPTYSFLAILAPPSVRKAPVSPVASEASVASVISKIPLKVAAPANVALKSSLNVSAVAKEFKELTEQEIQSKLQVSESILGSSRTLVNEQDTVNQEVSSLSKLESTCISEGIKKFISEKYKLTSKSGMMMRTHLKMLIEEFGDISLGKLDRGMCVDFKNDI